MQLDDLTEAEWLLIKDFIPVERALNQHRLGRTRACVNGILWRMRTGKPWSEVPPDYGNHKVIRNNFAKWEQTGVWQEVTKALAHARSGVGLREMPTGRKDRCESDKNGALQEWDDGFVTESRAACRLT